GGLCAVKSFRIVPGCSSCLPHSCECNANSARCAARTRRLGGTQNLETSCAASRDVQLRPGPAGSSREIAQPVSSCHTPAPRTRWQGDGIISPCHLVTLSPCHLVI